MSRARAREWRRSRARVDLRDEFARDFILPALQAGAFADGRASLGRSLSRPLIAKHLLEIARIEGARAIAHGGPSLTATRAASSSPRGLDPRLRSSRVPCLVIQPAERLTTRVGGIPTLMARTSPRPTCGSGRSTPPPFQTTGGAVRGPLFLTSGRSTHRTLRPTSRSNSSEACRSRSTASDVACRFDSESRDDRRRSWRRPPRHVEPHGPGGTIRTSRSAGGGGARHGAPSAADGVTPPDLAQIASGLDRRYAEPHRTGDWFSGARSARRVRGAPCRARHRHVRLKIFKGDCRVVGGGARPGFRPGSDPPAVTGRRHGRSFAWHQPENDVIAGAPMSTLWSGRFT